MKKLLDAIDKISTSRNLVIAILISAVSVGTMAVLTESLVYSVYGEANMPDTNFGYTYDDILLAFNNLGSEGLQVWLQVHLLDLVFPLGYSFAITFAIIMELRLVFPERENYRVLGILPILAALFDFLENTLVASQAVAYPNLSPEVIAVASSVTIMKWLLLYLGFSVVFVLLPFALYKKIKNTE